MSAGAVIVNDDIESGEIIDVAPAVPTVANKKSRHGTDDTSAAGSSRESNFSGSEAGEVSMGDLWNELTNADATLDNSNVLEMDNMFQTVNNDHSMAGVLEGFEMRSVYALLARIDPKKCVEEYNGLGGEIAAEHIERIARSVLWSLWRLARFAKRHKFDVNLSTRSWLDLNEMFDVATTDVIEEDEKIKDDDTKKRLLLNDDDIEDPAVAKERVKALIGNFDHTVKELMLRLGQVRGSKFFKDLFEERLTALNFLDAGDKFSYSDYAIARMRFVQFRNNVAYVNGFYLISLKPVHGRQLKYPAYEDRFGYLGQIATKYVRDKIFAGKRMPDRLRIFVNLTTTQACEDFNVLKALPAVVLNAIKREDATMEAANLGGGGGSGNGGAGSKKPIGRSDQSGVLALVQFGNVKYEPKNDYVTVRGYLVATFASTSVER